MASTKQNISTGKKTKGKPEDTPVIVVDKGAPVKVEGGQAIINKKATEKHHERLSEINESVGGNPIPDPKEVGDDPKSVDEPVVQTTDARDGGLFTGDSHAEGGIPAVVTDTGQKIEVEGREAILSREATIKFWKELSAINQSAGNGVPIPPPSGVEAVHEAFEAGGKLSETDKKRIYKKWKNLLNMTSPQLRHYRSTNDYRTAGLTRQEAKEQGISSGKESFAWILKMKATPVDKWTQEMWVWAKKQINFVSRMKGIKGRLRDDEGNRTPKLKALMLWGHNPETYEVGGKIEAMTKEDIEHLAQKFNLPSKKQRKKQEPINDTLTESEIQDLAKKFNIDPPKQDFESGGRTDVLLAPNGQPSNLTPEQYRLVRSKEFKAWFGDWEKNPKKSSKAVDRNGEPLLMYHGSPFEFYTFRGDDFEEEKEWKYKKTFWFTSDIELAKYHASKNGSIGFVYECFLNIRNPKPQSDSNIYKNEKYDGTIEFKTKWDSSIENMITTEDIGNIVLVDSNQIKLADGSNTTFDPENADIRFEEGGITDDLLAPNGQPSNLTPEQYRLVRSEEFKAWFGDWENDPETASKVLDENGEPLVVYHGSKNKFTTFSTKHQGSNTDKSGELGYFFTANKSIANEFATETGNIYECFLKICNPETLSGKRFTLINDYKNFQNVLRESEYDGVLVEPFNSEQMEQWISMFGEEGSSEYTEIQYVAFNPTQIKLADGSNTTFDPENADIRFKEGGITDDLLAPNGQPSNLTPEQYRLVRSEEFKAWFGDWENDPETASKVLDENGEPLVVYHGTNIKFNEFKSVSGRFFFTDNIDVAKSYRDDYLFKEDLEIGIKKTDYEKYKDEVIKNTTPIYEVFLRITDLKTVDYQGLNWLDSPIEKDIDNSKDGFLAKNIIDGGATEANTYVVFDSNQIKLADGSNTTFDPENADIRFEEGGSTPVPAIETIKKEIEPYIEKMVDRFIEYKKSKEEPYTELDLYFYRLTLQLDLLKALGSYLVPTDTVTNLRISDNAGKILINCTIHREGKSYPFDTEVIVAGGYNIQVAHYRYLVKTPLLKTTSNPSFDQLNERVKKLNKAQKSVEYINGQQKRIDYESKQLEIFSSMSDQELLNYAQSKKHGSEADYIARLSLTWEQAQDVYNPDFLARGKDAYYAYINEAKQDEINFQKKINIDSRKRSIEDYKKNIRNEFKKLNAMDAEEAILAELKVSPDQYEDGGLVLFEEELLLAPNGQPSNLNPEQYRLVRTPAFKAWFGDWENDPENASKVVDENGEPLVVYHGSNQKDKFYEFDSRKGKSFGGFNGFGHWFTDSLKYAKAYSLTDYSQKSTGVVLECFLNVREPWLLHGNKGFNELEGRYKFKTGTENAYKATHEENDLFKRYLRSSNKDGVFISQFAGDPGLMEYFDADLYQNVFVALDSNQIKLADGSNTNFNPDNPDIRFEEGGSTPETPTQTSLNLFEEGGNIPVSEKENQKESIPVDQTDKITVDVPFFIRALEHAREDIKSDADLHRFVDNMIAIRNNGTITMKDYDSVSIKDSKPEETTTTPEYSEGGSIEAKAQSTHAKRIEENMQRMNSDLSEWSSVEIKNHASVMDKNGNTKIVPNYVLPENYRPSPTMFPGSSQEPCCQLCGKAPVKNLFLIKNDSKKWLMSVGSECVTHFEEGKSGQDLSREFKIKEALDADIKMQKIKKMIVQNYSYQHHEGYGRYAKKYRKTSVSNNIIDLLSIFHNPKTNSDVIDWEYVYKLIPTFGYEYLVQNKFYGNSEQAEEKKLLSWYSRNKEKIDAILSAWKQLHQDN